MKTFLVIAACSLCSTMTVQAQSLDDILSKHYEALGGLEVLKSVTAMSCSGRASCATTAGTREMNFDLQVRDNKHFEANTSESPDSQQKCFPGQGWQSFGGEKEIEPVNLFGMNDLVAWREKGHQLKYGGTAMVGENLTYKLEITNGAYSNVYYLDTKSYLTVKNVVACPDNGTINTFEIYSSAYTFTNGVNVPYFHTLIMDGRPPLEYRIDSLSINPVN